MPTTSTSPKRLARVAGLLYLAVIVLRGLPLLVARPMVRISGDPAATAEAVAANQMLLRAAFVSELAGIVSFILLVMVLYRLLRHVDRQVAAAMVTFLAIAVAIASANLINHLAAVVIAADPTLAAALGGQGSEGLIVLFLELHEIGYSISEIFIGLWLLTLGYLARKSGWFPRPLAVLLAVGGFAYLTLAFAMPLFARFPEALLLIAAPAGAAQFWMTGYLLTRGVNTTGRQLPTPGLTRPTASEDPSYSVAIRSRRENLAATAAEGMTITHGIQALDPLQDNSIRLRDTRGENGS